MARLSHVLNVAQIDRFEPEEAAAVPDHLRDETVDTFVRGDVRPHPARP